MLYVSTGWQIQVVTTHYALRFRLTTAKSTRSFLKVSGRPELGVEGLANEALAACLAGDLRLSINEPFLVEIEEAWIRSIPYDAIQQLLFESASIGFGSKAAGNQWKLWSPSDRLTNERRPSALEVLTFDAFVDNDDRRPTNSNCLVKEDQFRIFDHELAFRLRIKLFPPPEPWRQGYLQRLVEPNGHIFGPGLKGAKPDFAALRDGWSQLSDTRLNSYLDALPREWRDADAAMDAALTHLRCVRDRIDECLVELGRALT